MSYVTFVDTTAFKIHQEREKYFKQQARQAKADGFKDLLIAFLDKVLGLPGVTYVTVDVNKDNQGASWASLRLNDLEPRHRKLTEAQEEAGMFFSIHFSLYLKAWMLNQWFAEGEKDDSARLVYGAEGHLYTRGQAAAELQDEDEQK